MLRIPAIALMLGGTLMIAHADSDFPRPASTVALLEAGESATIVCFGDSITGAYYHTGSKRAWTDMLGIALQRIYPQARPVMINAGISGNTAPAGLARIERDVIAHSPDLVVVMFGINDMSRSTSPEDFRQNLEQIVQQLIAAGSEVVLCAPTLRLNFSPEVQQAYREVVRQVGQQYALAVADTWAAFSTLREEEPDRYALSMSDGVHPNMHGHRLIAETVATAISGEDVSLADVAPPDLQMPRTLAKLRDGEPLRIVAMQPCDEMLRSALETVSGGPVDAEIVSWPLSDSIVEMEQWAKENVRGMKPDLVVVAVPAEAEAPSSAAYENAYEWVLNYSLDFGPGTWDCLPVLPSVTRPDLTADQADREIIARTLIAGKDLWPVERAAGDAAGAQEILTRLIAQQWELAQRARQD